LYGYYTGRVILNTVPVSFFVSRVMLPLCSSMICLTMLRPSPVPFSFVVKKGLNILFLFSGGIPGPVSLMVMCVLFVSESIFSVIWPPWGIASTEFLIRLSIALRIFAASMLM